MNWAQFKDPISHMCSAGTVVACWPLTQEVVGWAGIRILLLNDIFLSLNSLNSVTKIYRHLGKNRIVYIRLKTQPIAQHEIPFCFSPTDRFNILPRVIS